MIAIAPIKSLPDGSVATIPMSWADYQQLAASRGHRSAIPKLYQQVMAAIAEGASPPGAIRSIV
jgi:hypothetical protein